MAHDGERFCGAATVTVTRYRYLLTVLRGDNDRGSVSAPCDGEFGSAIGGDVGDHFGLVLLVHGVANWRARILEMPFVRSDVVLEKPPSSGAKGILAVTTRCRTHRVGGSRLRH